MPSLGELSVRLGMDSSDLEKGGKKAEGTLRGVSGKMRDVVNTAGKMGAALAVAGVAIVGSVVKSSMQATRELQNMADAGNANIEVLQRQAYAARTVGIEQDKYGDILKDVNDRVGDFLQTGAGPMADFFEKIAPRVGVTAQQFRNLSGPDALQLYVSSLEKANLSQAEMTFYMEAMSSDSSRLIPLLKNGGAEMARLGDEAARTGAILSAVDAKKILAAEESLARVGKVAEGAGNALTAELAPIIEGITDQLLGAAEEAGGFGNIIAEAVDIGVKGAGILADGWRGIEIAMKAVQVGAAGVQAVFASALAEVMKRFGIVEQAITNGINNILRVANAFGADFQLMEPGQVTAGFEKAAADARATYEGLKKDLEDLAAEPLPSKAMGDWVEDVRAKSQAAAEAAVAADQQRMESNASLQAGLSEQERVALEGRLAQLQESLLTEEELAVSQYEKRLELLRQARENELLTQEEYNAAERDLTKQHTDELARIREAGMTAMERFNAMSWHKQLGTAAGAMADMSAGVAQHSRKMFALNKAASLAQAVASLPAAVIDTFKNNGGYPWGIAPAAAMAATGAAQIAAIKNAQFNGGGSGGAPSQAPTPSTPVHETGGGGRSSGGSVGGQDVVLHMRGEVFGRETVLGLIEGINSALDDGAQLRGIRVSG